MNKDQEIIKTRNEVVLMQRNFLLGFLTVISTICLLALPNIPQSWVNSNVLLRISIFLLVLDIILIPWYLYIRIKKDLDYLDAMTESNRKGNLEKDFDKIEKKYSWDENYTKISLIIFIISMLFFVLSIVPKPLVCL